MEDLYEQTIHKLTYFIDKFQEIQLVTFYFEFTDRNLPYDFSSFDKKEILRNEFSSIYKLFIDYDTFISEVDAELRLFFGRNKPSTSKKLAQKFLSTIEELDSQLEPNRIKEKIKKDFIPENLYSIEKFSELTPYRNYKSWRDFKIEMLDKDYYFDDYFDALYTLLEIFQHTVLNFQTGYIEDKRKEKISALDTLNEVGPLNEVIYSHKWEHFIKICNYYSEERLFNNETVRAKCISRKGNNEFIWQGISGDGVTSVIPPLGAFVYELHEKDFFDFVYRYKVCQSFLNFFHLSSIKDGKKLLSKMSTNRIDSKRKSNRYIGYFKIDV